MLISSIVSIVVGLASVSVTESQREFPFTAGGAMIAGIPAMILSCFPMKIYSEDKKSLGGYTSGCFECCTILMVVCFSVTVLAITLGFGLSGIYGVVACSNEELKLEVCSSAAESKMAISIVTIILTFILFVLSLAIFFTCCCNAATFGMPLLTSGDTFYGFNNISIQPDCNSDRTSNTEQSNDIARMRHRQLQELAIQEALADLNRINDNNRALRESSAPDISNTRRQLSDVFVTEITSPHSSDLIESRYDDLPPSYDEVMRM